MANITLTSWGFILNDFQKSELKRSIKRHKLCGSDALTIGYAIERHACNDLSSIKIGKQAYLHPIYLFGRVNHESGYDLYVTDMVVYIADKFEYVATIGHDQYILKGKCFLDIFRKSEGYNPEHE